MKSGRTRSLTCTMYSNCNSHVCQRVEKLTILRVIGLRRDIQAHYYDKNRKKCYVLLRKHFNYQKHR